MLQIKAKSFLKRTNQIRKLNLKQNSNVSIFKNFNFSKIHSISSFKNYQSHKLSLKTKNIENTNNKNNIYFKNIHTNTTNNNNNPIITKIGAPRFSPGDELFGYVVTKSEKIDELNLNSYVFRHKKIGSTHLHLESEDTNNVFCSIFKTIPKDSTGVAHILEHTTLCGSQKYPVRDPFFNMLKRSLNTFMNAWTGSDFTAYPFSTQNRQDFKNLLNVYLDATFFPKLDFIDFLQEGHRLEFENEKLLYKGVVYNEMKGVLSNPDNYFGYKLQNLLYPGTTYGINSGGDPENIPELSHQDLLNFHKKFYHPSNARFFTYGHLPIEDHLEIIDSQIMQKFSPLPNNDSIGNRIPFKEPKKFFLRGPPNVEGSDEDRQFKVAISFLANDVENYYETWILSFLSHLIGGTSNSPMYIALLEPQNHYKEHPEFDNSLKEEESEEGEEEKFVLGTGCLGMGYDPSTKISSFTFGLSGVRKQDIDLIEKVIFKTLEKCSQEGFPQERIDSLIHQIELSNKHVTSNLGLKITQNIENFWIHDLDPVEVIKINKYVEKLKEDLKDPNFFQEKIQKYFLNNKERLNLVMEPDSKFMDEQNKKEQEKLKKIKESLKQDDIKTINNNTEELKKRQESVEDFSCLPTLTIEDIPKTQPKVELSFKDLTFSNEKNNNVNQKLNEKRNINLQFCSQPTNGLAYFNALTEIPNLEKELLPYIPLFCETLGTMRTKNFSHHELAQQLESYTGGIDFESLIVQDKQDIQKGEAFLSMEGMAFYKNIPKMFEILQEIIQTTNWNDKDLLRSHIMQKASSLESGLISSGHTVAGIHASRSLSRSGFLTEKFNGISQIELMQKISKSESLDDLIEKLETIRSKIIFKNSTRFALNSESSHYESLEKEISKYFDSHEKFQLTKFKNLMEFDFKIKHGEKTYITIPSTVNYVGKSILGVPFSHPDFIGLHVLSRILSLNYLHKEIREKGGAYGSGLSFNSGKLIYYSYRDPNVERSLNIFENSGNWVLENKIDQKMLDEAKLSIFQGLDRPITPSEKGKEFFHSRITHELEQERRTKLFEITSKDLEQIAEKYLQKDAPSNVAVVGGTKSLDEIKNKDQWIIKGSGIESQNFHQEEEE